MERDKELTIRLTVSPPVVHTGLLAMLLTCLPAVLGSETVTLQTYYPAPYGIYTQLRTVSGATLAESGTVASGSFVAIGATATAGSAKFRVVGTTRLEGALTVTSGGANITGDVDVTGKVKANGGGYVYGSMTDGYCTQRGSNYATCGGYATWVPGVRTEGTWFSPNVKERDLGTFQTYRFNVRKFNPDTRAFDGGTYLPGAQPTEFWEPLTSAMETPADSWWCCPG